MVWHALMALAYRTPSHLMPPSSPNVALVGINGKQPPITPLSIRFHLKLPPAHHHRPPSPPHPQAVLPPIVSDIRAVWDLPFSLPRPDADKESTDLAREAVSDACDGLKKILLRPMEFEYDPWYRRTRA